MIAEMTFTLYYSLLRRGLFESLGVWGEENSKPKGVDEIAKRPRYFFKLCTTI